MTAENTYRPSILEEIRDELPGIWKSIPNKGVFVSCLVAWVLLFEFLGNSTFGYIETHSLFAWTYYSYYSSPDDEHGFWIPVVVLALMWWKRKDFAGVKTQASWIGLAMLGGALFVHIVGYLAQQTRISIAAFYFGIYALIGLVWGWSALKATFFPMCLFAFALPLGTIAETITFPLRLLATSITGTLANSIFGIQVIHRGTLIYDPSGAFQYEIAAACGGLRSLTAVLAICTIFGFMNFKKNRNRIILLAAGVPLAILGNVSRLMLIIIASEAFGKETGQMVHDNTWFSLVPYIPPIIGVVLLGHWLRERDDSDTVDKDRGDNNVINSSPLQATT